MRVPRNARSEGAKRRQARIANLLESRRLEAADELADLPVSATPTQAEIEAIRDGAARAAGRDTDA